MSKVSTGPRVQDLPTEPFCAPRRRNQTRANVMKCYPEEDGGITAEYSQQPTLTLPSQILKKIASVIRIYDTNGLLGLLPVCLAKKPSTWLFLHQDVVKVLDESPLLHGCEESNVGRIYHFAGDYAVVLQQVKDLHNWVIVRRGTIKGQNIFFPNNPRRVLEIII